MRGEEISPPPSNKSKTPLLGGEYNSGVLVKHPSAVSKERERGINFYFLNFFGNFLIFLF